MIQIIPNFHPVIVHFPIALTIVAFAAALASVFLKKRTFANQLATVSHYLLWLAAVSAIVAVAFGWQAYNSVNHDDLGHAAMTVHKFWAFTTTGVLVLLALFDFKKHQSNTIMPIFMVCLLGLASALVGSTAWLGGEVVYRHGIGMMSLPLQEGAEGVPHEHGAGVAHEHDLNEHGFNKHATPQNTFNHDIKAVPDVQKPAMQGHDMSAMPVSEAAPAHDYEAASPTENQPQEDGGKKSPTVQDESKPHNHKHKE